MFKTIILKFSALFYHLHVFMRKMATGNTAITVEEIKPALQPYILKNKPSQSSKKIFHVNGNIIIGGTSQLIVDIIENTSDLYKHTVIVPHKPTPMPYEPLDIHCFSIIELQSLFDFIKDEKPDLVHIHYWVRHSRRFYMDAYWYRAIFEICEELNVKVVQNINVPTAPINSICVLENIFVSNYVKDNFNNGLKKSSVIYPGSNFSHFNNLDIESLPQNAIGMVYRLDEDKLNENSINIFIKLAMMKSDLLCYIIGGGFYYDLFVDMVVKAGVESQFIFTNFVSYEDLPSWYKKFSVFVTPVHDESFGQVTPFAMSMGHCVAGYDIGALSEILGSKDNLVTYGDNELLAQKILSLLNNKEARIAQGKQNQVRAHQLFAIQSMVDDYKILYDKYV